MNRRELLVASLVPRAPVLDLPRLAHNLKATPVETYPSSALSSRGGTDVLVRLLAAELQEKLKRTRNC